MASKLRLLLAAIAVVAFAAPSVASAGQITQEGKALPFGSGLELESSNWVVFSEVGTMTCSAVESATALTKNSSSFTAEGTSFSHTFFCLLEDEDVIEITNWDLYHLVSLSASNGFAELEFDADLAGGIECHFEGSAAVSYEVGSSSIHLLGIESLSGGICGIASIAADFSLTSNFNPVVLD